MDTFFQGLKRRPGGSLIERLENTSRILQFEEQPVVYRISLNGFLLIAAWFTALSFGVAVWYWLISGGSTYMAYLW